MLDHIQRMFNEAQARLHDADILAKSLDKLTVSQAIIRILAFEILLKCALRVCGEPAKKTHNYRTLWQGLTDKAQTEVLAVAHTHRMRNYADLSDIEKLLDWYQFIFEKARYYYELYEDYTLEEEHELSENWIQNGSLTEEAKVQYYPNELQCLIAGLSAFIEKHIKESFTL